MKARYIVLGLLMSLSLSLSARTYKAGESIYINTDQSSSQESGQQFNWKNDGAKLFLYFFQSTATGNNEWVTMSATESGSNVYGGTMSGTHPWYDRVIVVRKDPNGTAGNWDHKWNQSCDINIPDNGDCSCNYINIYCGATANWKGFAPKAGTLPSVSSIVTSGVTMEQISICPNDLKGPFSLRVKLNAAKTEYDYSDVKGHGWYKSYNGTTWSEVLPGSTGVPMDGIDDEIDLNKNQLPEDYTGGTLYYYLHSSVASGRRLIQINTNSAYCDLDCEITSFETAISNVNADDNTYTLDGMVAFGKANGKLVISCDGKSITIDDPKSPQAFSLHGVPAATTSGVTTTATAYFTGDQTNCSQQITIDVPNAKEAVQVVEVDSVTGKQFVLTPKDYDPANTYVWLANGDTIKGAPQVLVIDAYCKDSTTTYTYKEYYPASGSMDDIISNGDYEDATGYGTYKQKSTISDNDFWGIYDNSASQMNFYDTCSLAPDKKSNGFAVVRSAHNFYPTYAKISAKSGNNFALFDAATGASGANKKAWYATTATSAKLKLQKGTTYVLSFWAANINNYGEMDNAARFKFRIEYNAKTWESKELNLADAEFRNNIWHQCSQTFTADEDCDNVTISVVNLNNNVLNVGNDFALDDIQFHPISTVSKIVKSQQQFVVTAHEPKMDAFTATVVPLDCDAAPSYTVQLHAEYRNPKGRIIIQDDQSNTYSCPPQAVAFNTKAVLDTNIVITGLTPAIHTWEACFEEWPTAKISGVTTSAPVVPTIDTLSIAFSEPGCTDLTTTLTFDLAYTYQQGTLSYWVDDLAKQMAVYNIAKNTPDTLKALSFAGVPADGKNNHVLHISFDGAHSCVKDYTLPAVPFSPVIDAVTITGVPTTVPCGTTAYNAIITITPHYDATGKAIVLTYDSLGTSKTTAPIALTEFPYSLTLYNFAAGSNTTITAAFSTTPTCTTSGSYTLPKMTSCIRDSVTLCESQLPYFWPVGDQYYSGVVGENKYGVGTDSLFLFVVATPQISVGTTAVTCDDQSTIAIPFTVVSGMPDSIDIAIGTNHYTGSIVGTDIVFTRAAELIAGDYTATVTVGTKGSTCTSQNTVDFSVALGNSMYSKWTDVLFIDNKAGLFIGYQWYENGVKMEGETQQRLYKPEGLPGTYCCQLLMRDGKKIYTCEQSFDKVQPSRTEGSSSATIVRKYRVSPHVYIIQTETDGVVETKKILTAYE